MQINFKAIGAALMVSGTMLGAGMLALPLISEAMGLGYAFIGLLIIWAIMTYTGLMLLEVSLSFPAGSGFHDIAKGLFGQKGLYIINICLLLLLYSLSAAYISGGASTYGANLKLFFNISVPPTLVSIVFAIVISLIVFTSTNLVDKVNRILFSLNIIIFLVMTFTIQPFVNLNYLQQDVGMFKYMFAALPVFMTAFGFHSTIPSIIKYIGKENPHTLRNVIIGGSIIPVIVYFIWEFSTMGVLPREGVISFKAIAEQGGSVGMFLDEIHEFVKSATVPVLLSLFSSIALFTSYMCVSLGLFDSLASTFKMTDSTKDRLKTALICYIPPLVFALFYPKGFIMALGAAAIFLAVLAIFFPAFALMKLRRQPDYNPPYRLIGGKVMHWVIIIVGILIIVFQLLKMQGLLPVLS